VTINLVLKRALERGFDVIHRQLGKPAIYAVPWQTPTGLTYDADVDAWVAGDGSAPDPDLYALTKTAIPALWGEDAAALALSLGGVVASGDLVAVARAQYATDLAGAMMVITGSHSGKRYTVANLENAPDGGSAVFVVATLKRREQ
jgi:hypothetical protein